jgi:ATP-dependent DNA helicase PIF1
MKANDGTEDELKKAIEQRKKDTVHRIFLSEEQKHILNLVVNEGKSVFFTGSAGECVRVRLLKTVLTMF